MANLLNRRTVIAGVSAAAWASSARRASAQASDTISSIEQRHGGRLGVFAVDTGLERTMAYRADDRFLMCSTFKGLLAALILMRIDAGKEQLDRMLPYGDHDLIFTSPVTKANVGHGGMTVGCDNEYRPSCADEFWPTLRCLTCSCVLGVMAWTPCAVLSCGGTGRSPCL